MTAPAQAVEAGEIERLEAVLRRVERLTKPDRDLDHDIAEALGGSFRRVTGLGLNGRTPGSLRVFWPDQPHKLRGSAVPYFTKNNERAAARLRARLATLRGEKT